MANSEQPPSSEEIFKAPEKQVPNNQAKGESIDKTFRRAALLGHCLGLFPCSSVILKNHPKQISPHYLLIPTFVSVILYISSVIGSVFALLLYLKEFRTVSDLPISPTDSFALKTFLSALLISRALAPLFCLRKAKSIAILVQNIARYDKSFQIKNTLGFVNLTFATLLSGSIVNAVANTCVAWPVMYHAYKTDNFPTILRLFGLKSPVVEFLHTFSGGFYGELGMVFLSSTILFLARGIIVRIKDIQKGLFLPSSSSSSEEQQHQENTKMISVEAVGPAVKKLKALFAVKQDFEDIFGAVMVMYVWFAIVILVTTFYTLASFAVHFQFESAHMILNNEFVSVLSVVLLTCFRMKAFVELGENMMNAGDSLSTQISFINPRKCEKAKELAYIQRVSKAINFSFNAKGYFIMKRRLIPSIIGAVLSFTVVLAQFRDADGKGQWSRNSTTVKD